MLNRIVSNLGGRLGIAVAAAGFVALFLGWNGAASFDDVPAQMPYVISGGLVGLSLVVIGASLLVVESARKERADLLAVLEELKELVAEGGVRAAGATPDAAAALGAEGGEFRPQPRRRRGERLSAD